MALMDAEAAGQLSLAVNGEHKMRVEDAVLGFINGELAREIEAACGEGEWRLDFSIPPESITDQDVCYAFSVLQGYVESLGYNSELKGNTGKFAIWWSECNDKEGI